MKCNRLEKHLKENGCSHTMAPGELQQHLANCNDCKGYSRFVSALELQRDSQEKAPSDTLPSIEKRIFDSIGSGKKESFPIFTPWFKPAFAGFFALLLAVVSYTALVDKNVGYVENLSKRFKLAQFENIKSGDMLYAGDNSTAAISLKNNNKLQILQNTIVRVNSSRNLSLSRGAISLQTGDNELQIVTPDGLLLARNTTAKIESISRVDNGVITTATTCMVFSGTLTIKSSSKETTLLQGQKAVITENGSITGRQPLTTAETAAEKNITVKHKLFAAVESLCDCITTPDYAPGKKADHLRLFGKEVDENKFKVRVFWQEKGLSGLVRGTSNENNKQYSINEATTRRTRV